MFCFKLFGAVSVGLCLCGCSAVELLELINIFADLTIRGGRDYAKTGSDKEAGARFSIPL